jgi:hypothetical protein
MSKSITPNPRSFLNELNDFEQSSLARVLTPVKRNTLLWFAAQDGNSSFAQVLVEAGAHVTGRHLHAAKNRGDSKTLEILKTARAAQLALS